MSVVTRPTGDLYPAQRCKRLNNLTVSPNVSLSQRSSVPITWDGGCEVTPDWFGRTVSFMIQPNFLILTSGNIVNRSEKKPGHPSAHAIHILITIYRLNRNRGAQDSIRRPIFETDDMYEGSGLGQMSRDNSDYIHVLKISCHCCSSYAQ